MKKISSEATLISQRRKSRRLSAKAALDDVTGDVDGERGGD